jgi:polygalacturonase
MYGGAAGGADNTMAFQKAIAACEMMGGGHVNVPTGTFSTGAITLDNNIDLHLAAGATIAFNGNKSEYPIVLTRHEGVELMNNSPPIYAYGKMNMSITGSGTLDFGGLSWNTNGGNGINQLVTWDNAQTPVNMRTLAGGDSVAVAMVEPYNSTNFYMQGVTLKNANWWQLHPTLTTNVLMDGVIAIGNNSHTDGFDPESCTNVVFTNGKVTAGDDQMAIKAGRNNDGRRIHTPTSKLVIMHTDMTLSPGKNGGAITCGSEAWAIQDVYAYDIHMVGNGEHLLYMKTNPQRGGQFTNINVDTATGSNLSQVVFQIEMNYTASGGGGNMTSTPVIDNVNVSNVKIMGAPTLLQVSGISGTSMIGQITMTNDTFTGIGGMGTVTNSKPITYNNTTMNGMALH